MFADNIVMTPTMMTWKFYLEDVTELSLWCKVINLLLNVIETKELVVDFGRKQQRNTLLRIDSSLVERVCVCESMSQRKARQCLYSLRQFKLNSRPSTLLLPNRGLHQLVL